ncbi:MAG: MFS transporter [Candidatus Bathyarchaeota archaeon]
MKAVKKLKEEFSFLRGNILILVVSWVMMGFASTIPSTYYSLYLVELGGSAFIIGLIGFLSLIPLALVQFPGGYLADKNGRRELIVTMTFGVALTFVLYAIAPSWHFILIAAILQNLCLIYQPALVAIQHDSLPPEKRGMGFSTMMLINNIVAVLSPMIAGVLFLSYGLTFGVRVGYTIVVISYLAAAVVRIKLKETLTGETDKVSFREAIRNYPKAVKEGLSVWKGVPRSMLYLFFTFAIDTFAFSLIGPFMLLYATEVLQIMEFEWALLMAWSSIVVMISLLPSGKLIDKIGRRKPLLVSWLFFIPALWLFIYGDLTRLFIYYLIVGISGALYEPTVSALQADLVPREKRGKIAGSMRFFNVLLSGVAQLVGGFLYDYVSPQIPLFFALAATIPCTLLVLVLVQEPEKREI